MILLAPGPEPPLGQTATALLRKLEELRLPLKSNRIGAYIISETHYDSVGRQHTVLLFWTPAWARDQLLDRGFITEGGTLTKEGRRAALD